MSNVFAKSKPVNKELDTDYIPSGGAFETDLYEGVIRTAFIGKAAHTEARNVTLLIDVNGKELREQIWVTNRDGEVTYKDKKSGESKNIPGFNLISSLCMLAVGKDLGSMDVEELVVKLYDFESKKEIPQAVDCFTELHGEIVRMAVQKQVVDKTAKSESSGKYEPTGEVREINQIIKFFAADKYVTISEVAEFIKSLGGNFDDVMSDGDLLKAIRKMDEDQGTYAAKWIEKNKGQTYDKSSGSKKSAGKSFSENKSSGNAKSPSSTKSSLFDD